MELFQLPLELIRLPLIGAALLELIRLLLERWLLLEVIRLLLRSRLAPCGAAAPYRSRPLSYFGALLAPFGAAAPSWSCSGSLNESYTGSSLELNRLPLELFRLLLEWRLLLELIRLI